MKTKALAAVLLSSSLLAAPATAKGPPQADEIVTRAADLSLQLHAVLDKTEEILLEKRQGREELLRKRLREVYKLSRSSWSKLWSRPETRVDAARWRGIAKRILARDQKEIALLSEELAVVEQARRTLKRKAAPTGLDVELAWPSSQRKVRRAPGQRRLGKVYLTSRGAWLGSKKGEDVVAPIAGTVAYSGPVSGLGHVVLIETNRLHVLVGGIVSPRVSRGQKVEQQSRLGQSEDASLYLEVRLRDKLHGIAIDPRRLLP